MVLVCFAREISLVEDLLTSEPASVTGGCVLFTPLLVASQSRRSAPGDAAVVSTRTSGQGLRWRVQTTRVGGRGERGESQESAQSSRTSSSRNSVSSRVRGMVDKKRRLDEFGAGW
jgi:hypothetical protein